MAHAHFFASGLTVLILFASDALGAQSISGHVLDFETDEPVTAATVVLLDHQGTALRGVLTDSAGAFRLAIPATGRYRLQAERIGYQTVASPPMDVAAGDALTVELRMAVGAIPIAPLTVTASTRRALRNRAMDGFYDRRRRGFGTHFGPADIERLRPHTVVNLLQATPGVRIRYLSGTRTRVTMRSGARDCVPTLFVDGVRMPADVGLEQVVSGGSLHAVEVYRRYSEVPGEFASVHNYDCGAIVIWTTMQARR